MSQCYKTRNYQGYFEAMRARKDLIKKYGDSARGFQAYCCAECSIESGHNIWHLGSGRLTKKKKELRAVRKASEAV